MSDEVDLLWLCAGRSIGPMRNLAIPHNEDAMAEPNGLLQSVRSQNDRETFTGQAADEFVNLLLGAHVEPARGMIEYENSRLGVQPLREDDLLLVAAGKAKAQGY